MPAPGRRETERRGDLRIEVVQPIDAAGAGQRRRRRGQHGEQGRVGCDDQQVARAGMTQQPAEHAGIEGEVVGGPPGQGGASEPARPDAMDRDAVDRLADRQRGAGRIEQLARGHRMDVPGPFGEREGEAAGHAARRRLIGREISIEKDQSWHAGSGRPAEWRTILTRPERRPAT